MAMSRSFAVIAPSLWNRLPPSAHELKVEGDSKENLSYHPNVLRPYHFLKLVSFIGANRTKSASVCPWLLRGATHRWRHGANFGVDGKKFRRPRFLNEVF